MLQSTFNEFLKTFKMEKDNTEQEKSPENALDDSAAESKGCETEQIIEKADKGSSPKNNESKGYVSDFFDESAEVKKASGNDANDSSDLEKNPKQAFDQFKVKPANSESEQMASSASKQRRPSAEEIAKNWQDLGVQRCPNCKFTTDNMELFKNHCTTCPSVRSTGRITLTYNNGEFKCNTCDEVWTFKAEFEEHIVCHLQESPYVCLTCQNKKFPSRQQIEIHTKNEHPNGDARCGLKGMKIARKYSEELMHSGTISIQGKLSIPKTPRNHVNRIIPRETVQSKNQDSLSKTADAVSSVAGSEVVSKSSGQMDPIPPGIINVIQSNLIPGNSAFSNPAAGSTIHHRPILLNVINPVKVVSGAPPVIASAANSTPIVTPPATVVASSVLLQVSSASQTAISNQSVIATLHESDKEASSSRPMPPARTSVNLLPNASNTHLYTSKGGTLVRVSPGEVAKTKHLDTLFGELNRTTNVMQPTIVSQKIKDIANPSAADPKEASSKPIQYHLKTITEYTCTQSTKIISPSVSSMPRQNFLLLPVGQAVPVGQPIMQSGSGLLSQQPNNPGVFVPIQQRHVNSVVASSSIRVQQTPVVTTVPSNLRVVSQVPQNTVMLTTGAAANVRSQYAAGNIQYITQPGVASVQSVASSPRVMPPLQQAPRAQINPPPSYREAIVEKHSAATPNAPPVLTIPASTTEDIHKIPKKYLFKIKPGQGFVCEACKKFTRDEFVFRRHVWEHFHGEPLACKTCTADFIGRKIILECKLVNNIVCNLIKRSSQEVQEASSKPLKVLTVGENEVIDITDDEGDKNESKQQTGRDHATEVIVIDDEDESGDGPALQIRISNTFSLSSPQNLEQMRKKDTLHNNDMESPCVPKENDKLDEGTTSNINVKFNRGEQKDLPSSVLIGETQYTDSETSSTNPLSGQIHLKNYYGLKEVESAGHRSVDVKQTLPEPVGHRPVDVKQTLPEPVKGINAQLAQLDTREEKKGLFSSSSIGESQHTGSGSNRPHPQSGQTIQKNSFGLKEIKSAGDSSIGVEQSPASGEGEDDDDGKIMGTHLLDKSLSEPGNDSEEVVSQVLETNLKDYDPTKNTHKDDFCEEPNLEEAKGQSNLLELNFGTVTTKSSEIESQSNAADANLDHVNVKGKTAFESEILSKQSNNAFYVCGYENCLFTGMTSSKYREHIQSEQHVKEYNFICGHCGQKDYTEDTHVRHIFSHANSKTFLLYKCPIRLCRYKSNLLHMYADHLRAHPNEELTIKCTYCHKTFPSIDSLEQHLKQNLLKFVICPYCSFKFVNKYVVTTHIRLFHPDRLRMVSVTSQIVCNEREINFYVAPKSKAFHQSDSSEKDIQDTENIDIPALLDDFQKESLATEKTSQEQITLGKGSENGDTDDVLSLPEEDQGDFKEKEKQLKEQKDCQKEGSIRRPSKSKVKSDANSKGGPKSLECPHCSYLSYNQSLHAKHLSLHDTEPEREKRFVCNLCPKGADNLPHFRTHVRNHVGKHVIKVYCCTTCAYCSNQKCHIMDHVQDAHAEETLYTLKEELVESNHSECTYCAFKARTLEQVVAHETIVHRVDPTVKSGNDLDNMPEEKQDKKSENAQSQSQLASSENEPGTSSSGRDAVTRKKKYKYHCEYCSEFFKHKSSLKEHMINEHKDIENKQFIFFKCKYCIYTSTMKDMIIGHLEKDHSGLDLRILRKIEVVENDHSEKKVKMKGNEDKSKEEYQDEDKSNGSKDASNADKIEIVIPDGNIFKQLFSCPMCSFTTNMRIKAMKHLKEHPDVKPIRPDQKKTPSKSTARKSSSSVFPKMDLSMKKSTLIQQLPKTAEPLQNPFTAVKESVVNKDPTTAGRMMLNSPSKDPYILGEQKLHAALSACFIPFEKDMNFQCRICKQKIFKRFVLHRHILDHLKIVFFKCKYCEEGSIERTLMVGHIQKEHPSKTVHYDSVEKSVLEQQFKERIFNQDFNDTLDISATKGTRGNAPDEVKNIGIVKKAVHEYQTIDDDSSDENDGLEEPVKESEEAEKSNSLKCPKCRYVARFRHYLNLHMESHNDPMKTFTCSVCDYRGDKFSVIKHVYSVFHLTQAKVLENGKPQYENPTGQREKEAVKSDKCNNESKTSVAEVSKRGNENEPSLDSKNVGDSQGKQIRKDSITVSKSGVYEIKTSYKCKECGHKRDSKSAMYVHFKTSKCNKPVVKCSLCSFQNTVKAAIQRHATKRHPGKKISILDLPMSAKIKIVKIPVRQNKSVINDINMRDTEDQDSFDSSPAESSDVISNMPELESPEEAQIRCQLCTNYLCESAMKLQFHVNTAHQGAMLYCRECSYKSPLVKHMINHCKNLHYQKVALYGKEPRSMIKKTETDVKQEKVSKTTPTTEDKIVFKCPKCDLELSTLKSVQMHLSVHFNYKPYCCKYCGKCVARLDHMKRHIESQHEGKALKYDMKTDEAIELKVKKIYDSVKRNVTKQRIMLGKNRPAKLDRLELVEEGIRRKEKMFYCDFCNYRSDRRATVRNHVSNVHAGISKKRPLEVDSETDSPVKKAFKRNDDNSEIASSTCSSIDEDEDETEQKDDELPPLKYKVVKTAGGTKKFGCSGCDYMNEKIKNLKLHVSRNHGTTLLGKKEHAYKCCVCSYSTVHSSSNLLRHFKLHHSSMKTIKFINKLGKVVTRDISDDISDTSSPGKSTSSSPARSCTESVQNDYSPIKPVKQKRTGVTNYSCNYCDYSGKGLFQFRLHSIAHEEFTQVTTELDDESKMSCGYCSYVGKNTFDLSVHIASHMAEMRYKCAYCDYTQFQSCKVSQHMRYCHADRKEIVVDRDLRKATTGLIRLVNFNPTVEVQKMKRWSKKRKYKRIMIETDDSSNSSSSDNEEDEALAVQSSSAVETKGKGLSGEFMNKSENCNVLLFDVNDGFMKENNQEKSQQKEIMKDSEKEEYLLTENSHTEPQPLPEGQPVDTCRVARSDYEENSDIAVDCNIVSEEVGLNETQAYSIETQPFSPSDITFAECNELNDNGCDDCQSDKRNQEIVSDVSVNVQSSRENTEVKCGEKEESTEPTYMNSCQNDEPLAQHAMNGHVKKNVEENENADSNENLKASENTENLEGNEKCDSRERLQGSEDTDFNCEIAEKESKAESELDADSEIQNNGSDTINADNDTDGPTNDASNKMKQNRNESPNMENIQDAVNPEDNHINSTGTIENSGASEFAKPKTIEVRENTKSNCEITEKESKPESKLDVDFEIENNGSDTINANNDTDGQGSTNDASDKLKHNRNVSPNLENIEDAVIPEDSHINSTGTIENSGACEFAKSKNVEVNESTKSDCEIAEEESKAESTLDTDFEIENNGSDTINANNDTDGQGSTNDASNKLKQNRNESPNLENIEDAVIPEDSHINSTGTIENSGACEFAESKTVEVNESTKSDCEIAEEESKAESTLDTDFEIENNGSDTINANSDTDEQESTNDASNKLKQNENESPNLENIEDAVIPEDSHISCNESLEDCNYDNFDENKCANFDINKCENSDLQDDADNLCSSTSTDVSADDGLKENQNNGNKSPRNVFQSISDAKDAECEKTNSQNCDVIKEPIVAESKVEESKRACNEVANENVFEKFSSEIQLGESSHVDEKGEHDESNVAECGDNIFEKFTNNCVTNSGDNGAESESDLSHVENSEKNIFETFSNINEKESYCGSTQESSDMCANENPLTSINSPFSHNSDETQKIVEESIVCEKMDVGNDSNIFTKFSEHLEVDRPEFTGHTDNQNEPDINDSNIFTKFSATENKNEGSMNKNSDEILDKDSDKNLFEKFASENLSAELSGSNDKQLSAPQIDLNDRMHSDQKTPKCSEAKSNVESEKRVEDMEIDELINSIEQTVNERKTEESDVQNDNQEMETE